MNRPVDVSATLDAIESILILDRNNAVLHAGAGIQSVLCPHGESLGTDVCSCFRSTSDREALMSAIETVRRDRRTVCIALESIQEALYVFPAKDPKTGQVIISTSSEMERRNATRHALQERVKELECLYNISNELRASHDIDTAFDSCIQHLVDGFQYPEFTSVRIEVSPRRLFGDQESEPETVDNVLEEVITVGGKKVGRILVFYHQPADFLEEEHMLLREISRLMAIRLERQKHVRRLEKQQKVMMAKNRKLLELTEECGEARKKLQAVLEAITDQLIVIDADYKVIRSNREEIGPGAYCYKELFGFDRRCDNCAACKVFETGEPESRDLKIDDNHYVIRAFPILNDKGEVDRVVETCSDVTREKQMEAQLFQSYKLASIGKLVAGVAHEINNPNTFIRGNVKIIREAFDDIFPYLDKLNETEGPLKIARLNYPVFREHIPQLIEDMDHGTDRINKIVLGLRNFAKKDDGLPTDDVDLNELIRNDLRITQKEIKKVAHVQIDLDNNLPRFKGNRQKMEQVCMNLLTNAAQAIENGQGLVRIETRFDKENDHVILRVSDNGMGMDEKTRKHIFDPFFTTKRNKGGTGLGLSILYGIIEDHKGTIGVESKPGEGTTFTIRIPVKGHQKDDPRTGN